MEEFAQSGKSKGIFDMLRDVLLSKCPISREGSIVDASFCDAPHQRNDRQENETIREGAIPDEWLAQDAKSKHKLAQKDIDVRWAKRNEETHYGSGHWVSWAPPEESARFRLGTRRISTQFSRNSDSGSC